MTITCSICGEMGDPPACEHFKAGAPPAEGQERELALFKQKAADWNAEADRYLAQRDELLVALKTYVDWCGSCHVEGCPADDTCDCSGRSVNDAVNNAIRNAEASPAAAPVPRGASEPVEGLMNADEAMQELCALFRCEPDEILETAQRVVWAAEKASSPTSDVLAVAEQLEQAIYDPVELTCLSCGVHKQYAPEHRSTGCALGDVLEILRALK